MTQYGISFNGVLEANVGTVLPGTCVCRDSTGKFYIVSTPSNRNGQRTSGVVTFTSFGGKSVQIQTDGLLDREKSLVPFLADVNDAPIRVNSAGGLERAIPVEDGDEVVGSCNQWGDAILSFGQPSSSLVGDLDGDVTGPAAANTVVAIRGVSINPGAPALGRVLVANGASDAAWVDPVFPLDGYLSGYTDSAVVLGIRGVLVSATPPTTGQVLTATGTTAAAWASPSSGVTLAGDVTGASGANVVEKAHGATVPIAGALTTGNVLQVSGASALSYGPVNLAGGSNYVTGTLPVGNLPAMGGDVTGTVAANRVTTISGASAGNAVAMNSSVHLDWSAGSLSVASADVQWTGTGISVLPSTNQRILLSSISTTFSGLWIGTNAASPTVNNAALLMASGVTTIRGDTSIGLTSSSGFVTVSSPLVQFNSGIASPVVTQLSTASTVNNLTVKAQNCSASNSSGGTLILSGGTGTGTAKVAGVQAKLGNGDILMEAADVSTSGINRVLGLAVASTLTGQVPAGGGDLVVFVGEAAIVPTSPASDGFTLFSEDETPKYIRPSGFVVSL